MMNKIMIFLLHIRSMIKNFSIILRTTLRIIQIIGITFLLCYIL